jgi:hypothetical protein
MPNPLIEIETSADFFYDQERETNVNINIVTNKHLTLVPRSGRPHETNLIPSMPLASPSERSYAKSNKVNSSYTPEQKRQYLENKTKEAAGRLLDNPNEIYHISVSIYKSKPNKPERLTVNVDFVFDKGTKPFKTSADCISRSRSRELTANVRSDWGGYDYAKALLKQQENFYVYAGKLKNRKHYKALIPQRIIPRTLVIFKTAQDQLELIINDVTYTINLVPELNPKSMKYFQLRGSIQRIEEKEWNL